jgi:hypothetical protein
MRILTGTSAYLDDPDTEDDGPWYCLVCKSFYCSDCKRRQEFLHVFIDTETVPIIIFNQKDDNTLLSCAVHWQNEGRNPRVIDYEPDFGLSMTIHDLKKIVENDD